MRVSQNLIGVPGDECICGRRKTVAHCPVCGSTRRYARSNRMHRMLDGSDRFVKTEFRCMTCGHEYIDEERELCEAPPVGAKLASQKVRALHEAQQSGELLTRAEKKLADAINVVARKTAPMEQITDEQCDNLLRHAWPEAVFAFKSGKGPDPGTLQHFQEEHREEIRKQLEEAQRQGTIS